jgi:hypothetical protein
MGLQSGEYPQTERRLASDYRMADYQALLIRAIATMPGTCTLAARYAIYERARKAQLAQLRTLCPALPESEIAHEEEALDQAIALVESKFGGRDSAPVKPPFVATTPAAATQRATGASVPANTAPTDVFLTALSNLSKVFPPSSWLRLALAAVLGAVLGVAGVAIVGRQKPQDLAGAQPEAIYERRQPDEPLRQQPAKIAQRAQPSAAEGNSTAPPVSVPLGQPTAQSGAAPANQMADDSSPALPGAPRAAMLIASDNPQRPTISLGSTVWSTIPPVPGRPETVAVKADADIPSLKMRASMTLRKNTDPKLQASYTIDLKFSFADGAPISGVKNVEPKMRNLGPTASQSLTSVNVKISDYYFLIALANGEQDSARNLDLIQTLDWFDFPLLLNDNRIAKLLFQKSSQGEAVLAKAFEAWK